MGRQSSSFNGDGISVVREVDGVPSISRVKILEFTNGTVSTPSPGIARVDVSGSGGADSEFFDRVPFTYQTASPLLLQALPGGNLIDAVTLVVETPFNDALASVTCGTVGSPALVFTAAEVLLGVVGQYGFENKVMVDVAETLRLTLNPAGSTQGAGYVLFRIRK